MELCLVLQKLNMFIYVLPNLLSYAKFCQNYGIVPSFCQNYGIMPSFAKNIELF
jgi:hypothetical protein